MLKRFWKKLWELVIFAAGQRVSVNAAHVSFFLVLAAFPLLVLLLSILRYTGLDVKGLTDMLHGIVPEALFGTIERVILSAYRSTSGAVITKGTRVSVDRIEGVKVFVSPAEVPANV